MRGEVVSDIDSNMKMAATKLDTLPSELLSYICEMIYHSHKPSLRPLTLVNRKCSSIASDLLFRDICFSLVTLQDGRIEEDCKHWMDILTRRDCLESVRCLYVHGTFSPSAPLRFSPSAPLRFYDSRQTAQKRVEWQRDPREFQACEMFSWRWEEDCFRPLAELVEALPYLEILHWAPPEQLPLVVLDHTAEARADFRLEMPEWRLRHLAGEELTTGHDALISTPYLRNVTARLVKGEMNKDVLLHMLGGATPSLEEVRIITCDSLFSQDINPSDEVRRVRLQNIYERNEQTVKARLTLFSVHGMDTVDKAELDQWFDAADMTSLQRLELRSGVDSATVWRSTLQPETLQRLRELLLGFGFECSREEHDAASEWLRKLPKLQKLELHGNISPTMVDVALKTHGSMLRKLSLQPETHSSLFSLKYLPRDLEKINASCPLLQELAIPIKRGIAVGNKFHEAQNYAALSEFANLTRLHIILDCARWGEIGDGWILQDSSDEEFENQDYYDLDTRRITYGHVRYALINAAVDEILAKTIWDLVSKSKAGSPLYELYIQPTGSTEIIRGFRPDDWPEFAGRLVDLYYMLKEVSRPYKLRKHVRDDVHELEVQEPPDALPRGHWSNVGEDERMRNEVICHSPEGVEMEIFRRIWPAREGSLTWRDDWCSFELPMPEGETGA